MAKQPGLTQKERAAVDKAGREASFKAQEAKCNARGKAEARVAAKQIAIEAIIKARAGAEPKSRGRDG